MRDGNFWQAPYERITEAQFNSHVVTSVEDGTASACPVH
jgi:hypothetical protein